MKQIGEALPLEYRKVPEPPEWDKIFKILSRSIKQKNKETELSQPWVSHHKQLHLVNKSHACSYWAGTTAVVQRVITYTIFTALHQDVFTSPIPGHL